jgi:hypothetical protein
MLNDHLQSPVTRQRLRAGLTAEHIDGFADWLHDQGYKPASLTSILRSLAAWADWAKQAGFATVVARFIPPPISQNNPEQIWAVFPH